MPPFERVWRLADSEIEATPEEFYRSFWWTSPEGEHEIKCPLFDTNITLWPDLLQKIEEKGLMQRFADQLTVALGLMIEVAFDGSEWLDVEYLPALIKATPAQLTAALVATIEEVSDGS